MDRLEYITLVREHRDGWSNEIPTEILHSTKYVDGVATTPKFKCRRMWFQGVFSRIELGLDDGFISTRTKQLYDDFQKYIDSSKFRQRRTTSEDIQRGDQVLTAILEDLGEK